METARQVLQQRRLGVARLRLVPKKTGKDIQKHQQWINRSLRACCFLSCEGCITGSTGNGPLCL